MLKRLSFIVATLIFSSCGSSKQVATSPSEEKTITTDEINITMNINDPVETEVEEDLVENIQSFKDTIAIESPNIDEELLLVAKNVEHPKWTSLLQKYVNEKGHVNYEGFKSDKTEFNEYLDFLQNYPPGKFSSKAQKISYWINAYNAFTVDLILRNYPLQSIKDIKDPWDQRLWKIGDKWYNLNDIEHQILRKMDEPRIHFAIVCASESCPKLQNIAFHEAMLDVQLEKATKEFLSDKSKNIITKDNLKLSKIFKWFAKDFKSKDHDLIDFLNQYSDIEISEDAKKSFLDYNWDLNE